MLDPVVGQAGTGESVLADTTLREVVAWLTVGMTTLSGVALFIFLVHRVCTDPPFVRRLVDEHLRVMVGVPFAALISFSVVAVLEATAGPVAFSVLGMSFEGAAGPVVLWILGFLATVVGIRTLW